MKNGSFASRFAAAHCGGGLARVPRPAASCARQPAALIDAPGGRADDNASDIAVACVAPLIDNVFGADLSVVGAEEYQRVNLLLNNLFLLRKRARCFYALRCLLLDLSG